jgi:Domain of unknown function (DUF202)
MAAGHTPITVDVSTKLAYDRTRLAYERTLMAWVRTGVSLISFGFTIYKILRGVSHGGESSGTDTHRIARVWDYHDQHRACGGVARYIPACPNHAPTKSPVSRRSLLVGCVSGSFGLGSWDYSFNRSHLSWNMA